jgi:hypothetical protein
LAVLKGIFIGMAKNNETLNQLRRLLYEYTSHYRKLLAAGASQSELRETSLTIKNIMLAIQFEKLGPDQ